MLPGGTAIEIGTGKQHPSLLHLQRVRIELNAFQVQVFQQMWLQGLLGDLRQIFGWDDFVGIDIVSIDKGRRATKLFHIVSFMLAGESQSRKRRGSVIAPVIAAAAALAGLIRCTMPPLPMRPLKLRVVVEAQTSPSASTPLLMPRQAPQVGLSTQKPLSMKILINPSSRAWEKMAGVAGVRMPRTELTMTLPRTMAAASRISSIRPLVQEPM